MINFFFVASQSILRSNLQWSFDLGKRFLVLFILSLFDVTDGQRLDKEAEGFSCGTDYCVRWGYDACVNSSTPPYCLPCNQDQIRDLCGTKNELQGCNLYCADYLMLPLIESLTAKLLEAQQDNKHLHNSWIIYRAVSIVLGLTSALLFLIVISLCLARRWRKPAKDTKSQYYDGTSVTTETSPMMKVPLSTESNQANQTDVKITDHVSQNNKETNANRFEETDYGAKKLKGVNPSSDHSSNLYIGNSKYA